MKQSRIVCILFDEPAEEELLMDFLEQSKHPFVVASSKSEALSELQNAAYPVVLLEGNPRHHLRWLEVAKGLDHKVMVLLISLQEGEAWTQSPLIDHVVQPFDFVYLSSLLDLPASGAVNHHPNA